LAVHHFQNFFPYFLIIYRKNHFNTVSEIPGHPIGGSKKNFWISLVVENENSGMFKKKIYNPEYDDSIT
jgi:hypothetical protein